MGWKETCAVEERMRFMVAVEKQEEPVCSDLPAVRGEPTGGVQMADPF